ncbi:MAG: hypothetical protein E7609_03680 [Ruminococcaceae bacterium]|nr:hypothetical protein [Oscillospiraceae bacterium]
MEKKEFLNFLKGYFKSHGFEKGKGNRYYKNSVENEFLCEIDVFKSNYGDFYYLEYAFYLGKFEKPYVLDHSSDKTCTPFIFNRFIFDDTDCAAFCNYLKYSEEHFKKMLDENMERAISPPFATGKKYLQENLGTLYRNFLPAERVLPLLFDT